MPVATLGILWTEGSETTSLDMVFTGDASFKADIAVPAGSTALEADFTVRVAGLKAIVLFSDQNLTVKTNSSGSPQDTITLTAGVAVIAWAGDGRAALFAGDVTKLFIANATGTAATLTVRSIQDITP